ncbi:short chain dehydrogenase [Thozetella sp. PMI_491]|nr:short chain dehydrogenase [Thozetella sp. PMI_491]
MARYLQAHLQTGGPGDARPTAMQIVQDEGLVGRMTNKVFLITGCSSGIGIETARAIAATGARVFLAVRSLERGTAACESFLEPGRVELLLLDTSSLASVRAAAYAFLAQSPTLNVLICNAGIMNNPTREETDDGFEMQLATNYLGHFLLFHLLQNAMLQASTPEFHSRLINVASAGHHASEINFADFNLALPGAYNPAKAYGQSKLAQIYMSNYVDRKYGPMGLHALSLMPGGISTNLQKHIPEEVRRGWQTDPSIYNFMKSPEQGAATTVLAAVGWEWESRGGVYLENCRLATSQPLIPGVIGVKDYAYDLEKENRTWELTVDMLALR